MCGRAVKCQFHACYFRILECCDMEISVLSSALMFFNLYVWCVKLCDNIFNDRHGSHVRCFSF